MTISKPLSGLAILVTRSGHQAGKLSTKLAELGANVSEMALISIQPPDSYEELDLALRSLAQYDWIIFASANAAEAVIERLKNMGELASLQYPKIAAIGPATAAVLVKQGFEPAFSPSTFIAESMVAEFPGYPNLAGQRILWPRTNVGRKYLLEKLQAAGANVDVVTAYQTCLPNDAEAKADTLLTSLSEQKLDAITLMSSETVRNLGRLLSLAIDKESKHQPDNKAKTSVSQLLSNTTLATIGPETTQAVKKLVLEGTTTTIEAEPYTSDGLIDALIKHFHHELDRKPNH